MTIARQIIEIYEKSGRKVHKPSFPDVSQYLDEEVTITIGNATANGFGSGKSDHLNLSNVTDLSGSCLYVSERITYIDTKTLTPRKV